MKKQAILILILLCLLVSCKNNETVVPDDSQIENSVVEESGPGENKTDSEPDKAQSQSEVGSYDDNSTSTNAENSAGTEQSIPETDNRGLPVYSEQALADFMDYLEQSLTDSQHGGLHRVSDFKGSGQYIHGGPDKADPYVVVWVIDKNAVERAEKSYTGQKADTVHSTRPIL